VPVAGGRVTAADDRSYVESHLPPRLRGLSKEQIRAHVLALPPNLGDLEWALLVVLWGMAEPPATMETAIKVARYTPCFGDTCTLGITMFDGFRSQRIREARLVMQSLVELDARAATGSCRAPNWPDGIEGNGLVRSYILLRQADDRLRATALEWRAADASRTDALVLELCLVGSIAFWVVAGLLAGWAELEGPRPSRTSEI
jgi:hypothetical protein